MYMWQADKLVLYRLRMHQGSLQVHMSLEIGRTLSWELKICGKPVDRHCQLLSDLPDLLSTPAKVYGVLRRVDQDASVCTGNEESQYLEVAAARGGILSDRSSECMHVHSYALPLYTVMNVCYM